MVFVIRQDTRHCTYYHIAIVRWHFFSAPYFVFAVYFTETTFSNIYIGAGFMLTTDPVFVGSVVPATILLI